MSETCDGGAAHGPTAGSLHIFLASRSPFSWFIRSVREVLEADATKMILAHATQAAAGEAVTLAWQNVSGKK